MPTYLYRCKECRGFEAEATHPMDFDVTFTCPFCHATPERVPQRPGLSFKGDGWAGKE